MILYRSTCIDQTEKIPGLDPHMINWFLTKKWQENSSKKRTIFQQVVQEKPDTHIHKEMDLTLTLHHTKIILR